ncbi:MAG: hypothetical protein FWE47_00460 [Oscillospiraceae bacterium]|nr:hypothetical protein [Oscillospiraceae bacterium]
MFEYESGKSRETNMENQLHNVRGKLHDMLVEKGKMGDPTMEYQSSVWIEKAVTEKVHANGSNLAFFRKNGLDRLGLSETTFMGGSIFDIGKDFEMAHEQLKEPKKLKWGFLKSKGERNIASIEKARFENAKNSLSKLCDLYGIKYDEKDLSNSLNQCKEKILKDVKNPIPNFQEIAEKSGLDEELLRKSYNTYSKDWNMDSFNYNKENNIRRMELYSKKQNEIATIKKYDAKIESDIKKIQGKPPVL